MLELRRREKLRADKSKLPDSYGAWLARADRTFQWTAPHFRLMQQTLDRVTAGELNRVIFSIPIRHGKTEHNTYRYPTYRLLGNPRFRGLLVSYKQLQANKFSRDIRRMARHHGVLLSSERDAAEEWETLAGGGLRAVGIGGGTASLNADGIFIDDPIGSRRDAESLAYRDMVWDSLQSDILARAEPHTFVIMSMSRWNLDDPVARLLKLQPDRWHVVDLPGVAEEEDPLGRRPGELLWPEMRGRDWMDSKRVELGTFGFESLVQGRPRPREGGMFKWVWWQELDVTPAVGRVIRYWDLAGTDQEDETHDPDYTVGVAGCRTVDNRTAILDIARFRASVARRDHEIEQTARADRDRYGLRGLVYWFENDPGIGGKERTAAIVRKVQALGITCYTEPATGSKRLRAEPLASAAEAGNVLLCPGSWRDAFRAEGADFTGNGETHDDQIDAAAGMFNKLALDEPAVGFSHVSM
jgi:predicted phage terminase large subunit-like protein